MELHLVYALWYLDKGRLLDVIRSQLSILS